MSRTKLRDISTNPFKESIQRHEYRSRWEISRLPTARTFGQGATGQQTQRGTTVGDLHRSGLRFRCRRGNDWRSRHLGRRCRPHYGKGYVHGHPSGRNGRRHLLVCWSISRKGAARQVRGRTWGGRAAPPADAHGKPAEMKPRGPKPIGAVWRRVRDLDPALHGVAHEDARSAADRLPNPGTAGRKVSFRDPVAPTGCAPIRPANHPFRCPLQIAKALESATQAVWGQSASSASSG